jgi:type IV pilus assembly protein PilY1
MCKFFVGDADGALWRFDVSDTNPDNWKAEIFFDTMNTTFMSQTGISSSNAWKQRQPIVVPPVISLDSFGSAVVHVATGDTSTFTAAGTNYLVALSEKLSTNETPAPLRSNVDWWQYFVNGERVSGPMAVFDSVLYFATFQAAASTAVCSGGIPKLWGRDFIQPRNASDLSQGGIPIFNPGPPTNPSGPTSPPPDFVSPPQFAGKIIPGVSINMAPSCSNLANTITDPYTGSTHYVTQSLNSSQPQLFLSTGASTTSGSGTLSVNIPPPGVPTIIDSWASVVE